MTESELRPSIRHPDFWERGQGLKPYQGIVLSNIGAGPRRGELGIAVHLRLSEVRIGWMKGLASVGRLTLAVHEGLSVRGSGKLGDIRQVSGHSM